MAHRPLTELEQAQYFHARERRRSLAGIPDLHRTHQIVGATTMETTMLAAVFPTRDTLVTFKTAIRIVTGTGVGLDEHRGLVFEISDAVAGVALWLNDTEISFHAGEAGLVTGVTATFDNTVELPVGLELEIVAAVRPGEGRARVWGNGTQIADSASSGGTFDVAGEWASSAAGSFAEAFNTSIVADVIQSGAPSGFEVIEPLSVYIGSVPRHFW